MSSLAQRMNTEELQAANDGLCKRVEDQAALIRELVGALERLKDSYRMSAPPLSRMDAWHEVDSTLAKVPEEYRG